MILSLWQNLWRLSAGKKMKLILHIFLKISQKCCKRVVLGGLGMPGYAYPKWNYQLWKLLCLSAGKKLSSSPTLLWRYCKDMQTYFEYFEHYWLETPKMKARTCRRLSCSSACQKWTSTFTFFLRYYFLKNPAIWFADRISAYNSRSRILEDLGLVAKYQ